MRSFIGALAVACAACGAPAPTYRANAPTPWSVVLVTFDGVRWQELFEGADPVLTRDDGPVFERFWAELAPGGVTYGDVRAGQLLKVATSTNASLPGYMSIYGEVPQGCATNACGPIGVPTFLDRLHDELQLEKKQLEVVSAWLNVKYAVTSRDDVAVVKIPGDDTGGWGELDEPFEFDRGTAPTGLQALTVRRPRFLHVALLDSDRFAHRGDYPRYLAVLRAYDRWLAELAGYLDGNTALIVTTDHGRGLWDQWTEHGPQVPASSRAWAYVRLPAKATGLALEGPASRPFDHHDVRYTIETLFGLSTASTSGYSTGFVASP